MEAELPAFVPKQSFGGGEGGLPCYYRMSLILSVTSENPANLRKKSPKLIRLGTLGFDGIVMGWYMDD